MQESQRQTLCSTLGEILKKRGERQRFATILGINPLTLTRWVQGVSDPRPIHLSRLLALIAKQYPSLSQLLTQEFPEYMSSSGKKESFEDSALIPSTFYAKVLQELAILPIGGIHRPLRKHILLQALEQFDPQRNHVTITIARCVPPSPAQKVRSLQVIMGVGLSPWGGDLDQQAIFYGVNSVAGQAVASCQAQTIQNLNDNVRQFPSTTKEHIGSLSVHPILSKSRIAGTLSLMSTRPDFFLPSYLSLLRQYSDLLAITFSPEDFYASEDIDLRMMPLVPLQIPYLVSFRERVLDTLRQAADEQQAITLPQAELRVWQHIEEELIQMTSAKNEQEMIQPSISRAAQEV